MALKLARAAGCSAGCSASTAPARWLLAFSLAQVGEFAFVLLAFAPALAAHRRRVRRAARRGRRDLDGADAAAACSPTTAAAAARSRRARTSARPTRSTSEAPVIIAGYGRFGMTIGRLLRANGRRTVVLDHDAEQIEALRKFGFSVYYGDASRLDLLEAAGAKDAKVFVLAIDDRERALTIATSVLRHFPHLRVFARAFDRVHAYQLLNLGVHSVHREMFGTSVDVARDVLTTLGAHPFEAQRAAALFKAHDERVVRESAAHQLDQSKLIDISRQSRAEIAYVLAHDVGEAKRDADRAWDTRSATKRRRSWESTADRMGAARSEHVGRGAAVHREHGRRAAADRQSALGRWSRRQHHAKPHRSGAPRADQAAPASTCSAYSRRSSWPAA